MFRIDLLAFTPKDIRLIIIAAQKYQGFQRRMPYNPYDDEDVGIDGVPQPTHDRYPSAEQHQDTRRQQEYHPQHARVSMVADPEPMLPPTLQSEVTRRQNATQSREEGASPGRGPTTPSFRIIDTVDPSYPKDDFYHNFAVGGRGGQTHIQEHTDDEDEDEQISFLRRCPSLNLEFMWRRFHKARARSGTSEDLLSEDRLKSLQHEQGFPRGLAKVLLRHAMTCPIRCWIVDNSGTMHCHDGHRVVRTNTRSGSSRSLGSPKFNIQVIDCTRWEEVQSTVLWHAELAAWCQTPLAMRLVHDPGATVGAQQVGVSASKSLTCVQEVDRLRRLLRSTRPSGGTTPLTRHLQDILKTLQEFYPRLSYHRNPATRFGDNSSDSNSENWLTLVICTDGLPTDARGQEDYKVIEKFVRTLEALHALGVGIVVRLSTDEERVVTFYRTLDINANNLPTIQRRLHTQTHNGVTRLVSASPAYRPQANPQSRYATPRHLPVLDDYVSECQEVSKHNPWLHYGYPLHLCREQGITSTVFEALSQRPLMPTEVCQLIQLVFECDLPTTALGGDDRDNSGRGPEQSRRSSPRSAARPNGVPGLGMAYEEQEQQFHQQADQQNQNQRQDQASSGATGATDYKVFRANLEWYNKQSGLLWNPVKQKFVPWLDLKKLDQLYGKKQGNGGNKKGGCIVS